jgi:uncharacterized membrane protein
MLICDLITPVIMLVFGQRFIKHPPRDVNAVYGYRTARSMKSKAAWDFAHHCIGRLWRVLGLILLPLTCVGVLLCLGKDVKTVGIYGSVILGVQMAVMIGSICPVEKALKENFNQFGRRKK